MKKHSVALLAYKKPVSSVREVMNLSNGMADLSGQLKVFLKPNICFWRRNLVFPKWGVITTTRVLEDIIIILKEHGVGDITIGEGIVLIKPKDVETPDDAYQKLGYHALKDRYGVKLLNIHKQKFTKIDVDNGVRINLNVDSLNCDLFINIPVLKTHLQTVVSLGIKNLKGIIDIESRKICHNSDRSKNLHYLVSKLADYLPKSFTLIDGIYTNEIGPAFEGKIYRSNILIGSNDMLSADMVGARLLGYDPCEVPHLNFAAMKRSRPTDMSDIDVVGERIDNLARHHHYEMPYNKERTLPALLDEKGIAGISIPRYDTTICTYCATRLPSLQYALLYSWKGTPWDDVEILTGKKMHPTPGKKKTILFGKCIYELHKDNPEIKEAIAIKGCPPHPDSIIKALNQAGIEVSPIILELVDKSLIFLLQKYKNDPEFDESFYKID